MSDRAGRTRRSVFYTSIRGEVSGFQVAASSDPLDEEERRAIELHSAASGRDLERAGEAVRLFAVGASWGVTRIVPAAADYTGREGNVLAHTILLEAEDVAAPGFSVEELIKAGLFARTLPERGGGGPAPVPRVDLPRLDDDAPRPPRTDPLEPLLGDALPEAVAWLGMGKRVALVLDDRHELTVAGCEAMRALLFGAAQARFTFSTLGDNPLLPAATLCGLDAGTTRDSLLAWSARDPDLATFDLGARRWVGAPEVEPGPLEYARRLVALLRAPELAPDARVEAARALQAYVQLFAGTRASSPRAPLELEQDVVADAAELVETRVGLLAGERPLLKQLRCLLPYVRAPRVVDDLQRGLPALMTEALRHADVPVVVNACLVLLHRRAREGREGAASAISAAVARGVREAGGWAGPLLFELLARGRAAGLPPAVLAPAVEAVRAGRGRWSFGPRHLESLARFAGACETEERLLALQLLEDLLARAERRPALLAQACEAFGPRVQDWIPDDRLPVDRLVELFARSAEDLHVPRERELAALVGALVAAGHATGLSVNARRLLEAGLDPAVFVDACLALGLPQVLTRHVKRLREAPPLALARATSLLLAAPEADELLPRWTGALPLEPLGRALALLEPARAALELEPPLPIPCGGPLDEAERELLLRVLDDRVARLRRAEAKPLDTRRLARALVDLVGLRRLALGAGHPYLRVVTRNLLVEPRLAQARALALASLLTCAAGVLPGLLLVPWLGPLEPHGLSALASTAALPLAAALAVLAASRWRRWNARIGDAWQDVPERWRFRPVAALRGLAAAFGVAWALLLTDVVPPAARALDWPLAAVGGGVPPDLLLPQAGVGLLVLAGLLVALEVTGGAARARWREVLARRAWQVSAGAGAALLAAAALEAQGWVDLHATSRWLGSFVGEEAPAEPGAAPAASAPAQPGAQGAE